MFSDILHTRDCLGTKEDSVVPVAIQTFSLVPLNPERVEIPRNDPGLTVISADYQKKENVEKVQTPLLVMTSFPPAMGIETIQQMMKKIYMEAPCASPDVESIDDTGNDVNMWQKK